jgi:hypothetical protein
MAADVSPWLKNYLKKQGAPAPVDEEREAIQDEANPLLGRIERAFVAKRWAELQHLSQRMARYESTGQVEEDKGFRVVDASTIFAPLEDPRYVIGRVVPRSSIVLLAAYGSSSKTWQGIDACISVAAGVPWMGRFVVEQGPTCFVDFESGSYELRRRIQSVARARGLENVESVSYVSMPGLYFGDEAFYAAMEQLAQGRALIVLDSLRAASLVDENDSRIRQGLDRLRVIGERTGCAFIVLVHGKKTSGPVQVDDRESLRGSSAIFDAADVVLRSVYKKDLERFDVSQVKARVGRPVEPFVVRLLDQDGGVLVTAEDMPEEDDAGPTKAKGDTWERLRGAVLRTLKDRPGIGRTELRTRVGGRATTVDAVLLDLIEAGDVSDLEVKRGTRVDHSFRLVVRDS